MSRPTGRRAWARDEKVTTYVTTPIRRQPRPPLRHRVRDAAIYAGLVAIVLACVGATVLPMIRSAL